MPEELVLTDKQRRVLALIRSTTLPSVVELHESAPDTRLELDDVLRELEARGLVTERSGMWALTHSADDLLDKGETW